ncbi:MAG TPA: OmpH family outer membrane protein [Cytophagaceae bacterium]|jgi:outer membrane protein|nr:OmpH family outer membrane protein [Cytophagaceae bacterium]
MKNKVIILVALALMTNFGAFAQNSATTSLKLGYTNLEQILGLLPDAKRIESELQTYEKQLKAQMDSKVAEFEKKYKDYEAGKNLMADPVRLDKEKELTGLQTSIREFEETAQSSLQKKQVALLEPVIAKIQKSIEKVAAANGYSYILSTHADYAGSAIILYVRSKEDDITNLVLKDLGVTPPVANPAGTTTTTTPTGTK